MKNSILLITVVLLLSIAAKSQPVTYAWSSALGGANNNNGKVFLDKDNQGNVYVSGEFTGTRDFGSVSLTALGSTDIFIAKYNSTGNCVWAVRGGAGFSTAQAGGITVSGNNIFVAGSFANQFSLGSLTVGNGSVNKDVFIASLNTADGSTVWLEKAGGTNNDFATGIVAATGGGFYLCGTFALSTTFCNTTLTTTAIFDTDVFYSKFTSSGSCVWAKRFGGSGSDDPTGIKEVSFNEIVMNGSFEDQITFTNGTTITSSGGSDFFLTKFNAQGDIQWGVSGGGPEPDAGYALDTDAFGNIYSTGIIGGNAVFGSISIINPQNLNMFITKHNSSGICQWANMAGGISDDMGLDIATDPAGSSYVTGYVSGNPNFGAIPLPGIQAKDSYVVKYNTSGGLVWLEKIGSSGIDNGKSIIFDSNGACFTAGSFDAPLTLGSTPPLPSPPAGIYAIYLTRIGGGSVGIAEPQFNPVTLFPNPAVNEIKLNLEKITDELFSIDILNANGQLIHSMQLSLKDARRDYPVDIAGLATGSYFLRVNSSGGDFTNQFIVQKQD